MGRLTADQLRAQAALRLRALDDAARYRDDPWTFIVERCQWLDPLEQDPERQIAPVPADLPYLPALTHEWDQYRKSVTWKPRRMRCTWLASSYALSKAAYRPRQRVYLLGHKQGEDETQGSREMLGRIDFMLEHLRGGLQIPHRTQSTVIHFLDSGSTITAMSSNPRVLRGLPATLVVADEFGFWGEPEASLDAILPTLERTGQFIGLSSSEPGYLQQVVFDLDDIPVTTDHIRPVAELASFPGLATEWLSAWTNPRNRFRIQDLTLDADPVLRTAAGKAAAREIVSPEQWEKEYLKRFVSRGGRPVFEREWDAARMVVDRLPLLPLEPLLIGLDFGYQRPAAVMGQIRGGMQLRILRALLGDRQTTRQFVNGLRQRLQQWFPHWRGEIRWACDVAGTNSRGEDESSHKILLELGIQAIARYYKVPPTVERLRDYLNENVGGEPAILVDRNPDTRLITEGFAHGYRYPKATIATPNPDVPAADGIYIHLFDALRYLVMAFGGRRAHGATRAQFLAQAARNRAPRRVHLLG